MKLHRLMVVVVCLAAASSAAMAGPFDDVNVAYWAGTGSKGAMVVVDFGTGCNFAFGYRWDGDANSWMALEAIDSAGALNKSADYYAGLGWLLTGMDYPGVSKRGTDISFFTSLDGNTWDASWVGAADRQLADGAWDGFCFGTWGGAPDYTFTPAGGPLTPWAAPEPATLATLSLAGAAMFARHRKRAGNG
jgi:hypothetical protein